MIIVLDGSQFGRESKLGGVTLFEREFESDLNGSPRALEIHHTNLSRERSARERERERREVTGGVHKTSTVGGSTRRRRRSKRYQNGFRGVREPGRRPDVLQRLAVFTNRSDANRSTNRRARDAGENDSGNAGVTVRTGGVRRVPRRFKSTLHGGLRQEIVEVLLVRLHEQLAEKLSRNQPAKLTRGVVSDVHDGGVHDDE